MQDSKQEMFRNRLTKVYRHLSKMARKQNISCYRVYDHDLPEFPLAIELYANKVYVAEYKRNHGLTDEAHQYWIAQTKQVIQEVLGVADENIFVKLRQRKTGRQGQYQKTNNSNNECIVEENNLQFIVNLHDYLDTGLFLDHRITRKMVMEQSRDKRVLNLFAYTGSFSVYAAAGGATYVETVDLSKTYTQWAVNNAALNGFKDASLYKFVQADVLQYLKTVTAQSFDIIIMDPPTFSNSKRMDDFLDIQQNHVELINDCMQILAPNGQLYFSTNARKFVLNENAIKASAIKDITKATTPFDFEGKLFRWCYLINK